VSFLNISLNFTYTVFLTISYVHRCYYLKLIKPCCSQTIYNITGQSLIYQCEYINFRTGSRLLLRLLLHLLLFFTKQWHQIVIKSFCKVSALYHLATLFAGMAYTLQRICVIITLTPTVRVPRVPKCYILHQEWAYKEEKCCLNKYWIVSGVLAQTVWSAQALFKVWALQIVWPRKCLLLYLTPTSIIVSFQQKVCQLKSLLSLASKFKNEYSVQHAVSVTNPTIEAKRISTVLKKSMQCVLLWKWKNKALHDRYFDHLNKPFVDKRISLNWLRSSRLKGVSEGFICAVQDQCLRTRNYSRHILHESIDEKCRLCHQSAETLDHLLSSCEVLAKTEYIVRHNTVAK